MLLPSRHIPRKLLVLGTALAFSVHLSPAQVTANVVVPSSRRPQPTIRAAAPQLRSLYPWKLNIISTVFWIGETPTLNNPVPNHVSSWDRNWKANFGGFDDPSPSQRVASHSSGEFRPKLFIPKLNTFYIALPYNDKTLSGHRPEASRVIPWFKRVNRGESDSALKGRWVQVYSNNRSCYAQWEDVGPFVIDDWPYVFGDKRPLNTSNKGAGIDLSPAVRDYLGIPDSHIVHWRFVDDNQVPFGPWKKYGAPAPLQQNPNAGSAKGVSSDDVVARQRYVEYLKRLRDEQYRNKSKADLQNGQ